MGWFLVTIALPVLAPLLSLLCMRAFPLSLPASRLALVNAFKDGQLCWPSMGFCVSGLYELTGSTAAFLADAPGHQYMGAALIVVLVLASLFSSCGIVFTTPRRRPAGVTWLSHFRVLATSVVLVAVSAFVFTIIHLNLSI
ncbi:hypothetical protein [Cupriavidus pauculus]|uniref:hypothetical protein n=1 Tax=Cupriavidus pauculus TaxID=82633 RepID=UPI003857F581